MGQFNPNPQCQFGHTSMLKLLRSATRSWIAWVFVFVLAASFAVWGLDGVAGGPPNGVAQVGDTTISRLAYKQAFDREINAISDQAGRHIGPQEARRFGIDQQVLARMIEETALDEKAAALGVRATPEMVRKELEQIEAFIDPATGQYSAELALRILQQNDYSPRAFEESLRAGLARTQLMSGAGAAISTPATLAELSLAHQREERSFSTVTFGPEPGVLSDVAAPEEGAVTEFYNANLERYREPERRSVTLVRFRLEDFAADADIGEAAVRDFYEAEAEIRTQPETRNLIQITAELEEVAKDVAARLANGQEPEAVTQTLELPAPNVWSEVTKDDLFDPIVAERVFLLEPGGVSEPIAGALSYSVWLVESVTPAAVPSYETLAGELREQLVDESASAALFEAVELFEGARDTGATLEQAAAEANAVAISVGPVDQRGVSKDGLPVLYFAGQARVLQRMFEQVEGIDTELIDLGPEGFAALRVDRVHPAATPGFEELSERVIADFEVQRETDRLNALADRVASRLRVGESASRAAEELGPDAVTTTVRMTREDAAASDNPRLFASAFQQPPGEVVIVASSDGGRAIARVDSIFPPAPPQPGETDAARETLATEIADDIAALFLTGLREDFEVRYNEDQLNEALGLASEPQ